MIIPKFKERAIPVYFMEDYINEEPTEEEKQFKRIHKSIKEVERLPTVEEMTAILEYEETALDYCFKLAINTFESRNFEKNYTDLYNATISADFYKKALPNGILYTKYCTLRKILAELNVIRSIKNDVKKITFNYNQYDKEVLSGLKKLTDGWKFNLFIH